MANSKVRRPRGARQVRKGSYVLVLVTCGTRREAAKIAQSVVSERLAACVNILEAPVRSVYRWKGVIERSTEFLLLMKTSRARLEKLQAAILRLHSYDVPEMIVLPIVAGSAGYLAWLAESVDTRVMS